MSKFNHEDTSREIGKSHASTLNETKHWIKPTALDEVHGEVHGAEERWSAGGPGQVEEHQGCCILDELQGSDSTGRQTSQEGGEGV